MPGTILPPVDIDPTAPRRVPVGVECYIAPDGTAEPHAIVWADGRRWSVECEWAEPWGPRTAGGAGVQRWRYRVRVLPGGQRKYLYWDVPGWHVEVAAPMRPAEPEPEPPREWWPDGWA